MTEQDAFKIYEQTYSLYWKGEREWKEDAFGIYEHWKKGHHISWDELEQIATTFASVLRALHEENAALRTSLGEAQGLLASRHFPRPLI